MCIDELIVNNTAFGIAESVVRWPSGLPRGKGVDVFE